MLVQNPFAVEIPPLLDQEKGLLDNSFPASLGAELLVHLGRIGEYLIRQFWLTLKRDVIYIDSVFTFADECGEMHAMQRILVEQLEYALRVIEVEEEGLRLDLVDLADKEDEFVEIDLTYFVYLDVLLEPLLLLVGQQPDSDVWQPLTEEHPIFIIAQCNAQHKQATAHLHHEQGNA